MSDTKLVRDWLKFIEDLIEFCSYEQDMSARVEAHVNRALGAIRDARKELKEEETD